MKICSKCKEEKELSDFPKDKTKKDGYDYLCKKCKYNKIKAIYENPEQLNKHRLSVRKWMDNSNNRDKKLSYHKNYYDKMKLDPKRKLSHNLGTNLYQCLKKNKIKLLNKKTQGIVGLSSWDEVRKHIESTWTKGMSWDNYGIGKNNNTWHVDHIKPTSLCINEDEVKECFHYTNLRAMWGSDNIRKSNKF